MTANFLESVCSYATEHDKFTNKRFGTFCIVTPVSSSFNPFVLACKITSNNFRINTLSPPTRAI